MSHPATEPPERPDLERIALSQAWPVSNEKVHALVDSLVAIATTSPKAREKLSAVRLLVQLREGNLAAVATAIEAREATIEERLAALEKAVESKQQEQDQEQDPED
jgi:hypothetical protein